MLRQTLTRFAPTQDGVFGRLGKFQTIEEEWRDNQPRISCIPTGVYRCVRSMFHRGGYETFEVLDVEDRTLIKFHIANTEEDLLGCIGLGLKLGVLRVKDEDSGQMVHKLAAISSRSAFNAWMEELSDVDEFMLEIVDYAGEPKLDLD